MLQDRKLQLTDTQRDCMRAAGRFNAQLLDFIRPQVQPGVRTDELDRLIHQYTLDHGHTPACVGYLGFPKSCCISVNDVICHGIPGPYVLKSGDIVNIDVTSIVDGWHGDQSETFLVGEVSQEARRLAQCALDCLYAAISRLQPGCAVSEIGEAVVAHATECGFSVVKEYVGHGIGRRFHQHPNVPHVPDRKSRQDRLLPGMCFTVEPMVNAGSRFTRLDPQDGWTVRTRDGHLSAQYEHTLLMTEEGPEILTLTEAGPQPGSRL